MNHRPTGYRWWGWLTVYWIGFLLGLELDGYKRRATSLLRKLFHR